MTQGLSRWEDLLGEAYRIIDTVNRDGDILTGWTFGGGTAMMLQVDHRESHDIDLFIDDPQLLPYVQATVADMHFDIGVPTYSGDGTRHLKVAFEGIGEIDFIAAGHLTAKHATQRHILGRVVSLETISEIVAKKVRFRGASIQPRDVFDIAVACEAGRLDEIAAVMADMPEYAKAASDRLSKLSPDYIETNLRDLMIRPRYKGLIFRARSVAQDVLRIS